MTRERKQIALFPLTTHVLPGGRSHLRIFEPRYLRMVKDSLRHQQGFGLCMLNPDGRTEENTHIMPRGTLVEIVDFDQLDDGLLGITVAGRQLFDISEITQDPDGLRHGQVTMLPEPGERVTDAHSDPLCTRLAEVFSSYPEISELYPQKKLDDQVWVCQRWLELLPLKPSTKQALLRELDSGQVSDYLYTLLQNEHQA